MIEIPERLATVLSRDRALSTAVHASLDEFEPWLEAGGKRPTFFPDYTDHSLQHIQEVLQTADSLIRAAAWPSVTPADVAVLVLATLLHDSAMHLTREGFEALVAPDSRWEPVPGFDDKPWPLLWADFVLEARRMDQRKLIDLFGDGEPIHPPDLQDLRLDDRTRRLIGEFVRRHHPRLAHEIARVGAPGPTGVPLRAHGDPDLLDLAGLIARSHGMPARACLPYLKEHFGTRTDPLGVHAVFLIVILRVADYLQLQAGRAPERALQVHRLRSPYSVIEWKVHASIKDIREHEEDPEAIYIRAKPEDVQTYLRLKGWLSGLQDEIDSSWAVLGEVYARRSNGMDKLGIRTRRIHSNLDHESEFARTVQYVPREVGFTTADAELLKLLIYPLYGDHPEVGIRELIQNAVDAVRELAHLRSGGLVKATERNPAAGETSVSVTLEREADEHWWLTIRDGGIGMTADTICNYFLRAGASFRNSERWRSLFSSETDHSAVLRSGRFGIGVLAAFLLGDEVHVETRPFDSASNPPSGLRFRAKVDSHQIELFRTVCEVGTTVRVRVSDSVGKRLTSGAHPADTAAVRGASDLWDWYCLAVPQVERRVQGRTLPQRYEIPGCAEALPDEWRRIGVPGYDDIQWTYADAPALACNGLRISESRFEPFLIDHYRRLTMPNVSVFDADGRLPLNLQRDRITSSTLPFQAELREAVVKDYVATAVLSAPERHLLENRDQDWYLGLMYPGLIRQPSSLGGWLACESGIAPATASLLWDLDLEHLLLVPALITTRRNLNGELVALSEVTVPPIQTDRRPPTLLLPIDVSDAPGNTPMEKLLSALYHTKDDRYSAKVQVLQLLAFIQNSGTKTPHPSITALGDAYSVTSARVSMPKFIDNAPYWGKMLNVGYREGTANHTVWRTRAVDKQSFDSLTDAMLEAQTLPHVPLIEMQLKRRRAVPRNASKLSRVWKESVRTPIPYTRELRTEHTERALRLRNELR